MTLATPVRFAGSAESAAIQDCFSLTTNQRTVLSATIIQRNEQGATAVRAQACTMAPTNFVPEEYHSPLVKKIILIKYMYNKYY
jgi:hypothetical protein